MKPSKREARPAPASGVAPPTSVRGRFTFHGNVRNTRYGWLRLTPAYSVHLVRERLAARTRPDLPVLDPFCGTGTTLLACSELGIDCTTIDVNPFLVWLARAKTANYSPAALEHAAELMQAPRAVASRATSNRKVVGRAYAARPRPRVCGAGRGTQTKRGT